MENPKTAFVLAINGPECYLVGFPDNDEFNSAVQRLIIEKIIPNVRSRELSVLHFYPDVWEKKIGVVLKNQLAWKTYYLWFSKVKRLRTNWKKHIPVGFSVEFIDENILKRINLKNFNNMINITQKWTSIDDFIRKGYGFCLIHKNKIISWCMLNKRAGNKCEIAIGTDSKHRNFGFATLLGNALLEYCFSNNLEPNWYCLSDNLESIAVAKKIGFTQALIYPVYFWVPRWSPYLRWIIKEKPRILIPTINRILRSSLRLYVKTTKFTV